MTRTNILSFPVDNESDVGVCRRKSVALANEMGFSDVKTGEVAIIVTELVTNILKHGGGRGKVIICQIENSQGQRAIEIWSCDVGKGITDLSQVLKDGFSQSNSLGLGLGSIRRFSDELEVNPDDKEFFDQPFIDTSLQARHCIRSRKWLPNKQWLGNNKNIETGAASRCKPGESLNGDAYVINYLNPTICIASVIDGLGHGKEANLASQLARQQILQRADQPIDSLMITIHNAIRGTRGVTIGVAYINTETNKLFFSGIGNIESFIMTPNGKKNLLSFGGIMGHNMRTPRVFEFPFNPGDILILHSDGITSRWKPEDLDWKSSPQKNAEIILNQFSRPNDDATVLIISNTL